MRYSEIRQRVLERIRPTEEEVLALTAATEVLVAELSAALQYSSVAAEVFVGGSSAKGTGLRSNYDVDLFVRFVKEADSDVLEAALKLLPDDYERVHGSRDYFQLHRGEILYEIVPVLLIDNPRMAENVTDMSPLHVTYAQKRLTPRMRDEVRLAKQFCKAQRIYGAESYIQGFSGHVLELLIMSYGTFRKLLRAAASWDAQTVIDPESHHANPLHSLNKSKIDSPLVLVDPVQPVRNAAAALSEESYKQFIAHAQRFLRRPTLSAFRSKPYTPETIRKKYSGSGSLVIFELCGADGKRDVVGAKCLKAFEYIRNSLEGFTLLHSGFVYAHEKRCALAFLHVREKRLPATYEREGPPLHARKNAESFMRKHAVVSERNKRLYAIQSREHRTLRAQVRALMQNTPVTSRVTSVLR